ncbi:MAG TPA: PfkB family carbohydrate kinase [Acidobacteriaceae bacterium]|nr:PfkB family carbohydrate kinase [Acidobacteriaceae bacterium]
MRKTLRVAAVGELLWDLLPDGPQLGGAPANFAAILAQVFACEAATPSSEVFLVSSVGDDPLGIQARHQLIAHDVRPDFIAVDSTRPTGTVEVRLDAEWGPLYRICGNVAWDAVPETPQLAALAPTLDAVCFGTLAQRSLVTRTTLRALVHATRPGCLRVFDVNLRPPDWTADSIVWGCEHATICKMNHEEVMHVANAIGAGKQEDPLQVAQSLLERFPIHMVAITRGPQGSLLVTRDAVNDHPGIPAQLADSIGAGDCFAAALTYFSLHHRPLPAVAEAANRWGAWAASQRGGMPFLDPTFRASLKASIDPSAT